MDARKLAAFAAACLVLPASTVALSPGSAVRQGWAPARETDAAEQTDKASTGVSPIPTSHPELAAVDLFARADYSLPSDYCGWYADYKSASYTCGRIGATCLNIGDYRGCCDGPTASCASTFYSTCINSPSASASTPKCGESTLCCSLTEYPDCGTIVFSSTADPHKTYTLLDCFSSGFGSVYPMQDAPPATSTSSSGASSMPSMPPEPSSPAADSGKSKTNTGAIVGGVIGGVAVIGLVVLGVIFIYKKRPFDSNKGAAGSSAAVGGPPPGPASPPFPQSPPAPYQQQPGPMSTYGSPAPQYDPNYAYMQQQQQPYPAHTAYAPPMGPGGYYQSNSPPPGSFKMGGTPSPGVAEMPAPGSSNAHELSG